MLKYFFGKQRTNPISDEELLSSMTAFQNQGIAELEKVNWDLVPKKHNPLEIVIKDSILDTSALTEGEGNKTLYRPETFVQYIGQSQAKKRLIARINGAKKLNEQMAHVFLSGSAGQGKTSLAYIIAKELGNQNFVQMVGGSLKSEQEIVDKLVECNGGVIFLDEVHKLKNKLGNFLLPIIEDFQINGKKIKPFTMICATTEKGELMQHLAPFIQRFGIQIELEDYTQTELVTIFKQFHAKKYSSIPVSEDIFSLIALNCRLTPRIGLSLFKDFICNNDIKEVFINNQIVKDGFTKKDIKVLEYLSSKPQGASKVTIAYYLSTSLNNYSSELEPFLIKNDLIEIGSRRRITQKGKEFLAIIRS